MFARILALARPLLTIVHLSAFIGAGFLIPPIPCDTSILAAETSIVGQIPRSRDHGQDQKRQNATRSQESGSESPAALFACAPSDATAPSSVFTELSRQLFACPSRDPVSTMQMAFTEEVP